MQVASTEYAQQSVLPGHDHFVKLKLRFRLQAFLLIAGTSSGAHAQAVLTSTVHIFVPDAIGSAYSSSAASGANLPNDPGYVQQVTAPPQQATPSNSETEAERKERERREEGEREVQKAKKQRAGGVLPLFNVVISGQTVPLTPKQKFDLSWHTIIDPYTIGLAVVAGGGFGEIEDSHTGYDHGPEGLFKRIAASYADNAIGNVIGNAALPILLRQDPRYYRKGEGPVLRRAFYSAKTTFICYGDNGKKQFNTSNILGNFIAGGISNAYYPSDERGFGLTVENASTVTLEGMIGAQLLEFSPDLNSYIHKRREHHRLMQQQQTAQAAAKDGKAAPATPGTVPPAPTPIISP